MAQAVRENNEISYRVPDVRAGKRVLSYFQTKILEARAASFESTHAQLIQVYSSMDVALRRDLFEPTAQTTLDQYRELLTEKEELWIEAYKPRLPTPVPPFRRQRNIQGLQHPQQYQPQYFPRQPLQRQQPMLPQPQPVNPRQSLIITPVRSSTPCHIHLAHGETYYHPASSCRLRDQMPSTSFTSGQQTPALPTRHLLPDQQGPKIEVINFQEHNYGNNEPRYNDARYYDAESTPPADYNAHGMDNYHQDLESDDYRYEETDNASRYFVATPAPQSSSFSCATCYTTFPSRNKLFKHLREMKHLTTTLT